MTNVLDRLQGGERRSFHLSETQIQMDEVQAHFVSESTQWQNLIAMTGAGLACRFGRLATFAAAPSFLESFPGILRFASHATGLFSEVLAFRGISHGLGKLSGNKIEEDFLSGKGFGRDLVNFAALKITGHVMGNSNFLLNHFSQTTSMVGAQQIASALGFSTKVQGSLAQQFLQAEIMNVQMGFGAQLAHTLSGGRIAVLERSLDLKLEGQKPLRNHFNLRDENVSNPLFAANPFSGNLEVKWVSELDASQRAFIADLQASQAVKREAGLLDYYREVMGDTSLSQEAMEAQFSQKPLRDRYLAIKEIELIRKGIELHTLQLEGVPDAAGQSIPIHVEIHRKSGVDSKGVIFFLGGYGESTAMQGHPLLHFVESGYTVVSADTRGHGFSGYPLGMEGYMGSPGEVMGDFQLVLRHIQQDPSLNSLPLFGFGFSQGALFHTLLAQYNPRAYSGLFFVSPTHQLGRRFEAVLPAKLAESGKQLSDYANLTLDIRSNENPKGNLIPQDFIRLGSSAFRHRVQKWLKRGFVPPYFVINDSSVLWRSLNLWAMARAEQVGSLSVPAYIAVGSRDSNIGGTSVMEKSRLLISNPVERVYLERDHQLLLEGTELVRGILEDSVEFFEGVMALEESPKNPDTGEVVFHSRNLAMRASALIRQASSYPPAQMEISYSGTDWNLERTADILREVVKNDLLKRGQRIFVHDSLSGEGVAIRREREILILERKAASGEMQSTYLFSEPSSGILLERPHLVGQAFPYRNYWNYQKALIDFVKSFLGEAATDQILVSCEDLKSSTPDEYGPALRGRLLAEIVSKIFAGEERPLENFAEIARWVEEAYAHLDFRALLYFRRNLKAGLSERYDERALAYRKDKAPEKQVHLLGEMPLGLPLIFAIPREDALRDFSLRHGLFEQARFPQENSILLRDPRAVALLSCAPAFKNKMAILIGNLALVGSLVAVDVFIRDPSKLAREDLEFRADIIDALKDFREFVRIFTERREEGPPAFLRELLPSIQDTYRRVIALVHVLPPALLRDLDIQNPPSFEELELGIR